MVAPKPNAPDVIKTAAKTSADYLAVISKTKRDLTARAILDLYSDIADPEGETHCRYETTYDHDQAALSEMGRQVSLDHDHCRTDNVGLYMDNRIRYRNMFIQRRQYLLTGTVFSC